MENLATVNGSISLTLFPVVGIGASAGGLEAFKKLLKVLPANSGMAYVFVQHPDPARESKLTALLQKATSIPVLEITNGITIQQNHIYVLPGNKLLTVKNDKLILKPRTVKNKVSQNNTVDVFFASLAEVYESHAIGVVLSGTATDGTKGLKAIKDHGGFTIVQNKASAAYQGMPQSAINSGMVDFVLTPEKIPQKLAEVAKAIADKEQEGLQGPEEEIFKDILSILRIRKGMDFTYYKQTTIRRRIVRRMVVSKFKNIGSYLKYLQANTTEQDALYQDMLIPVTSFFRDKKVFDNLCESVFPGLLKNKSSEGTIRIWIAGCSTGEEAYSIAICFKEYLGHKKEKVQIFATDLSEPAIIKARTGIYTKADAETVSAGRLKEYFTYTQGTYQVNKDLRDMCVFAVHNFLKDPPFSKIDFISCRNVLIYMDTYLQKKALATFHYALNPKGLLMLGKSENTIGITDLFATQSLSKSGKNEKIFFRKDVATKVVPVIARQAEKILPAIKSQARPEIVRTDFQKIADDTLLKEYTPAAVVVNDALDIVHFRGDTDFYLKQFPGKPSHNLLKMAKMGLAFELRSIVHKVRKDKKQHKKEYIPVRIKKNEHTISIEVRPLPDTIEPFYLILFDNQPLLKNKISTGNDSAKTKKDDQTLRIHQLEKELTLLREDMRSITEDQEAINEELQSTNEELLSSNEELQSLNEELETSKEELQSTIEELSVVNQEMVTLNEQLATEKDYAEAVLATIPQPMLVLDKNLRVTIANELFYQKFLVSPNQTEGRLVYEIGNKQWDIPALRKLLESIVPQKKSFVGFEVEHGFEHIGHRIMRLNAREIIRDKSEKRILLVIEDVTGYVEASRKMEESEKHYRQLADSLPTLVWETDAKGNQTYASKRWQEFTGLDPENAESFEKMVHPEDIEGIIKAWTTSLATGTTYRHEVRLKSKEGKYHWFQVHGEPLYDDDNKIEKWVGAFTDITERKEAENAIQESEEKFRNMAESSDILIGVNNETIDAVYFNKTWEKLTGRPVDNLLKLGWADLLHPEDKEPFMNKFLKAFENKESYDGEFRMLNKEGTYSWLYAKVQVRLHPDGSYAGHISSSIDITERKQNEKALKESEEKTRIVIENAPFPIGVYIGKELIIEFANKSIMDVWGKGNDVVGKSYYAILPELQNQKIFEQIEEVMATGIPFHAKNQRVDLVIEGKLQPYYFNYSFTPLYNSAGQIYGVMNTAAEITDLVVAKQKIEESEAKLQSLIAAAPIGIGLFIGRDLVIESPNQEFIDIIGKGPDITGKRLTDVMPELIEYGQPYLKILDDVFTSGKIYASLGDPVNIIRNGIMHHGFYNIYYVPLFDTGGKVYGIMDIATDVTEQVLNKKKIEESEERFHNLADESPIFIFIIEPNPLAPVSYWNKTWLSYTGQTAEEAAGRAWDGIIHPDDVPVVMDFYVPAFEKQVPYFIPAVRVLRQDGAYRWHSFKANPRYLTNGEFNGYIGVGFDIHEQKLAEDALKESEEKFSTLADNMENLAWLANADGWIHWYNKRWYDYTGTTLEEMQGWGWEKVHHPDHLTSVIDFVTEAWKKNEPWELTFPLRRHDGEYRWFLTRGYPVINDDGKIIRWIGTNTDINEQKKAEEQFRILADQAPMWVWLTDKKVNVLYTNPEVLRFLGIKHYTEFTGHLWEQKVHPEEITMVYESFAKAASLQQPFSFEFRVLNAMNNGYEWFHIKAVPRYEGNEFTGFIGTGINIHEQKNALALLEYRKALLEAHNEASLDGILLVDAKGKILSYNHKFIEIWNMPQHIVDAKDDEAALSFAMTQLVHPEQFIEKVKYLYEHPTETSTDILEFKDGKIVERHGYPVMADDGSYYAWSWTFREITEQKEAENKIIESEKQLRKTTEHFEIATTAAAVGTWSLDLASERIEWSGLHKKIWGYDEQRTDLLYEDWHKIILPGDKEAAFAEVEKALKTKTIYEAVYRIKRPDNGDIRWIRSIGQYFYNDAGEPVTLTGVSIDITDQHKAEVALKESENLYHNLIYSSPSAIGVLMGPDFRITKANEEIIRIWGKGSDVFGKPYFQFMPELIDQGYPEVFNNVYNTGTVASFVETPVHILQNGVLTLKYYNFILYPQRNINNQVEGIGIIATEVTSQAEYNNKIKENEKRFRLLADTMPQHVWTADEQGNLNYFNQTVFDYSGLSLEQIMKDGWLQIVHPDDREENIRQWTEAVTNGTDFLFEHRFRRYDGEYRWQLSRAVPQKDIEGNITMWVGSSTEIQKIKEEEQRKGDFLKMVSHELKTPVTSIKGYVQLLLSISKEKKEISSDFLNNPLSRIDNQIGRLGRLIAEMLDLSRLESGKLEMQKEIFSLDELLQETIQDIIFTNTDHTINLSHTFKATVNGDRNRIGQVIINLVNNAIKYSPGENKIEVWMEKEGGNQVAIYIKDYGIGIAKEDQEKIFERFYRAGGESEKNYSGFGIGLFLASQIMLRHDGFIQVESEKDKGSVFKFALFLSPNKG